MSSIALFNTIFVEEKKVREQLAAATDFRVVRDTDIISEVSQKYGIGEDKVERALYGPPSVFNTFTLERERITAYLKVVMAGHLKTSGVIYCGNIALLVPSAVTHVLRVGLFDKMSNRIQRAVGEGVTEKNAVKVIKKNDSSAAGWADYLYKKEITSNSLYDIVVPMGENSPESAVKLILENYNKPAVLEQDASRQAVNDMAVGAKVELALVEKGYTTEVRSTGGEITLLINKSVSNFQRLVNTLTEIAESVEGVAAVKVLPGQDYHVSVYRSQEFTLPPKVLLVDDEQEFVQTLSDRLNTRNYGSYPVFDGEQALELLVNELPDVMVLDLKMPGIGGVDVLRKTKEFNPDIKVIILTGHGSEEDRKVCMKLGAYAYLHKPVDIAQLTEIIDEAHGKVAAAKMAHI
ncbi:CheY-like receiver, AAA-type ATPase and DNA-binding domain-containing response regulator [Desulfocapsa sulfexigens DSM 10523]|uniref:CheY-like receiver, AAA-type ATPase and DNA-binding domain-containing response regulator n=1 Tax=Desulfocapsa sulfexigens (strain DSM 10523 / SB164P1) TaxID=1167006 RepID=M1NFT4_DESSD|nr:response regulator [Desulfocapsa sulfexigens]AGF78494.1 CheY-like receiver, AAA-type ATPase and DNA-binding domain-containing response regulator [Desulfocapsa sulfexigens DSM 10523]